MSGDFKKLAELAEEMRKRQAYSEPTFRCGACSDTGFLIRVDEFGRKFGRRCECLKAEIAEKHRREAAGDFKLPHRDLNSDLPF